VEVPRPLAGYVDSCLRFLDEWDVAEELIECSVISYRWLYGGTVDLIAKVGAGRWLLDWKTGSSGVWPETALQLAAYAHADVWIDPTDDEESPLPIIDHAAAVWLRADGYDVIPVDIGDDTFRSFLYCQQVAKFVRADRSMTIGDALAPPDREASA
jgi:hypothetical protein